MVQSYDGEFLALWGEDGRTHMQRLDASGQAVGGEVVLAEAGGNFDTPPVVAGLPGGGFVLVSGRRVISETDEVAFLLSLFRYDEDGALLDQATAVEEEGVNSLDAVEISVDGQGNPAVAWLVRKGVFARLFDADLNATTAVLEVGAVTDPGRLMAVDATRLAGGRTLVTWEEMVKREFGDLRPDQAQVFGRFVEADGELSARTYPLTDLSPVFFDPAADLRLHADVEVIAEETFLLTWSEAEDFAEPAVVWGRALGADGTFLGPRFRVHQTPLFGAVETRIVPRGEGSFAILWTAYPTWTGKGSFRAETYHEVRGRLFLAPGKPTGGEFRIPPREPWPFTTHGPAAGFAEGGLVVVWRVKAPPRGVYEIGPRPLLTYDTSIESLAVPLCDATQPTPHRLCLQGGRYVVEVDAPTRSGPGPAPATAAPLTDDTGTFWFFRPANVELMVKVLDGTPVNGNFWFFSGALSNVDYTIRVTDLWTGQEEEYASGGRLVSLADTTSFQVTDEVDASTGFSTGALTVNEEAGSRAPSARGRTPVAGLPIAGDATILGLHEDRFQVTVEWEDPRSGTRGSGFEENLTGESGYFWFFRPGNAELVIKVLDGTPVNGHWWVFVGGLTDVAYTLTVEDTLLSNTWTHENPPYALESSAHTAALPGAGGVASE